MVCIEWKLSITGRRWTEKTMQSKEKETVNRRMGTCGHVRAMCWVALVTSERWGWEWKSLHLCMKADGLVNGYLSTEKNIQKSCISLFSSKFLTISTGESQNHSITKVGKGIQDHPVQPSRLLTNWQPEALHGSFSRAGRGLCEEGVWWALENPSVPPSGRTFPREGRPCTYLKTCSCKSWFSGWIVTCSLSCCWGTREIVRVTLYLLNYLFDVSLSC